MPAVSGPRPDSACCCCCCCSCSSCYACIASSSSPHDLHHRHDISTTSTNSSHGPAYSALLGLSTHPPAPWAFSAPAFPRRLPGREDLTPHGPLPGPRCSRTAGQSRLPRTPTPAPRSPCGRGSERAWPHLRKGAGGASTGLPHAAGRWSSCAPS